MAGESVLGLKLVSLTLAGGFFLLAPAQTVPVCGNCHPEETSRYLESAMGKSVGPPTPLPSGRVKHERSGSVIAVEQHGTGMIHRMVARGLTAEYEIAYQIGAGKLASTYVVEVNGYLFESPATWFRAYGWDVSPGYARAQAVDFDRPINETCLFCHAGAARFSDVDGRRLGSGRLTAITCERCHGPSEEHVRQPSARNIVNPGRLGNRARDSVCEQCHLEGSARILNPGKSWRDFRPGGNLEQTVVVYVLRQNGQEVRPVSQVEQLASSKCALASGGKLWCGSCHQAHSAQTDRTREIRQVCLSCHGNLSTVAHPKAELECVSCHMPRVATEYAHVAITDHRILRRPAVRAAVDDAQPMALGSWFDPPAELRQRDLTLANLAVGHRLGLAAIRQTGLRLFDALSDSERRIDSALLSSACEAMLDERMLYKGVDLCRLAREREPQSADRAMTLGIALNRAGKIDSAERELKSAILLDPSLKHAYIELWNLYDGQKKTREMSEIGDQFLNWNPRNIMFRVLKEMLAQEQGGSVKLPKQ